MSDLLKRADQFYAVASDLRLSGEEQLRIAAMLEEFADMFCEKNMRQHKEKALPDEPPATPGEVG